MAGNSTDYRTQWRERRHRKARRRLILVSAVIVLGAGIGLAVTCLRGGGPVWSYEFHVSSPVYCTARDGQLFCALPGRIAMALDAATGRPLWSEPFVASRGFAVPPAIAADKAVYVSDSGAIVALDRKTGRVVWQQTIGSPIRCQPLIADGTVYVGTDAGTVYAFGFMDGKKRWQRAVGAPVDSGVVSVGELLVTATVDGKIVGLQQETGEPASWGQTVIGLPIVASPVVVGERVIFGTSAGRAYVLDASSGMIVRYMNMPTYGLITRRPLADGGMLYLASNDGWIVAWHREEGPEGEVWTKRWERRVGSGLSTGLAMDDENLYCGTDEEWLIAVSKNTGTPIRRWECPDEPAGSVAVSGEHVIVGMRGGEIIAFRRNTAE